MLTEKEMEQRRKVEGRLIGKEMEKRRKVKGRESTDGGRRGGTDGKETKRKRGGKEKEAEKREQGREQRKENTHRWCLTSLPHSLAPRRLFGKY